MKWPSPSRTALAAFALATAQLSFAACGDAIASARAVSADPSARRPALDKQTIALPTGVELAYLELGARSGEPVVFLHGITDTSRSFLDTARHLAALRPELRLLALDLRGHGASSMPDPGSCRSAPERCFRVADFAADTIAFLDALVIPSAHLVGHSLGSLTAQEVALQHPERVRRMALIANSASVVDHPAIRDFFLAALVEGPWRASLAAKGVAWPDGAYELAPLDADPEAEAWMLANWVTEPTADPRLLAAIAADTARVPIGTWLGAARAALAFDTRERLRGLTVPTLVLWPIQDPMFLEQPHQRELLDALHAATRDCALHFTWKQYGKAPLPESGVPDGEISHNMQWGPAEAVAQDLAAFLREGGEPTRDLVFADPADPRRLLVDPGAAKLVEGRPSADAHAAGSACRQGNAVPPSSPTAPR
jgi:pimeloyl-ACP methyl ester carboxylesterase